MMHARFAPAALVCILSLGTAGAGCASSPLADDVPPEDFAVSYGWSTGSIPPPHNYTRCVEIAASGEGSVEVAMLFGPTKTWAFQVGGTRSSLLYEALREAGVFSRHWREDRNPPVGGSSAWLDVTADGSVTEIPRFVVGSQTEAAEAAHAAVQRAIPGDVQAEVFAWLQQVQTGGEPE